MTPKDFFDFAKKHNAKMVDLKFVDLLGTWQHCSYPIEIWDESIFKEGLGFDGSSIRGWQGIHQSDMIAIPQAEKYIPKLKRLSLLKFMVWTEPEERVSGFYLYIDHIKILTNIFETRYDGDDLENPDKITEIWGECK